MHELGHNLKLEHGGSNSDNCKPNYLSVMNYNLQAGIPRVGGGFILDYSPPRQALDGTSRSFAPLGPLVENGLDENNEVDLADGRNQTIFMNLNSNLVTVPLNAKPNYSGDPNRPAARVAGHRQHRQRDCGDRDHAVGRSAGVCERLDQQHAGRGQ